MNNKKYELIPDDTIVFGNRILHRIRALVDFRTGTEKIVKIGTLGGYVETKDNLSHLDHAWVGNNARVFDRATVCGNACVKNRALVSGNAYVTARAVVSGNAVVSDKAFVAGTVRIDGHAYVGDNVCVSGNAHIGGNVSIRGNAHVSGNAYIESDQDILVVDNIGSRNDITTFYKTADGGIGVTCGCFSGTIDEFAAAVEKTHGDNKYGREYRTTIELAKIHIGIGCKEK